VGVEGSGVQASALSVVPPAEACTETNWGEEAGAASDLEAVLKIEEANVEEVGVMLD
jgi:hypothetical protein